MVDINERIGENLVKLLERKNKTQNDLADYMGVTQATVSNWCKGLKVPRMDKIDDICDFFNVPRTVLFGEEPTNSAVKIPVLGTVVAGLPIAAHQEVLDWEEIPTKMAVTGEYFGLKVKGTSMEPRFVEGDVVIVRQQPDVESGDIAVILINGEDATLKKVIKGDGGITLIALNMASYEPHFYSWQDIEALPVRIIGKVVELRGKF